MLHIYNIYFTFFKGSSKLQKVQRMKNKKKHPELIRPEAEYAHPWAYTAKPELIRPSLSLSGSILSLIGQPGKADYAQVSKTHMAEYAWA